MYNDREERDYGVTAGHVVAGIVFGAAVGAALGLILGAAAWQRDPPDDG